MNQIPEFYSTPQVSSILGGTPEATIRGWKREFEERFVEGTHFFKEGTATRWLMPGVEVLRGIKQARDTGVAVSENLFQLTSPTISPNLLNAIPTPTVGALSVDLLRPLADQIAPAWIEQNLPIAIEQAVLRLLRSNEPSDRARLQSILESLNLVLAAGALRSALNGAISDHKMQLQGVR